MMPHVTHHRRVDAAAVVARTLADEGGRMIAAVIRSSAQAPSGVRVAQP
jgi:hypothetical protein